MADLIERQAAIDAAECIVEHHAITPYKTMAAAMDHLKRILNGMPSAQPTLYGYKIEHLAFIARVMEKENVPPEKVIEIMTDIGKVVEMIFADAERIRGGVNDQRRIS